MQRLTSAADFRRVYATGRASRVPGLDVRVAPGPGGDAGRQARIGITIRRAAVRTSVQRNRWKRWVREVFRRHPGAFRPGWDIVVSVTQPPTRWRYHEVEATLLALVARAHQEGSP